jgi:hypothetical protein
MTKRGVALAAALLLACAGGCKKGASDKDAIRASIAQHLKENSTLNMAAMDMDVRQVTINGDRAQAQVEFRLKQGGTSMQVVYNLERRDGVWSVLKGEPAGGQIAHPPMDKEHQKVTSSNLPKLHMSLEDPSKPASAPADTSALPPGHPPIGKNSSAAPPDKSTQP